MISVSVVVPVYSGESYLEALVQELESLRDRWVAEAAPVSLDEVVLVDDNAIDGSAKLIDLIATERPWVVALHLSRNFGQHAATVAGILHTSGDWVVTLDEDLQHPPEKIPEMLRKAATTHSDIVYGNAEGSVHEKMVRDFTSRFYKRLIELTTRNPTIRHINSFRLVRGSIARAASSVCSHDTYFDVALSWFTQRISVVRMSLKDSRYISTGKSGYKLKTLLSHARRLLLSSQLKILRLGGLFGLFVVLTSFFAGIALTIYKLSVPDAIKATGWTSLILTTTLFSGVIIVLIGMVLEYLGMLVLRAHGKPLFFTINRDSDAVLIEYFGGDPT